MSKQSEPLKKPSAPVEQNLLIWLAVSLISWSVYIVNGGVLFGLWADFTLAMIAVWIFRYVWQWRKPAKGWNTSSIKAGLIAALLCFVWLVVLGFLFAVLPKSTYFN